MSLPFSVADTEWNSDPRAKSYIERISEVLEQETFDPKMIDAIKAKELYQELSEE